MARDRIEQGSIEFEIERFARMLWRPGDVRELRVPKHNKYRQTAAGWFETPEALAAAAIRWDCRGNVFVTLNPVESSLLARANGRVDADARATTSDKDVTRRRWLFIDIDAERPSGISSTDAELDEARKLAVHVRDCLIARGWPAPAVAMSGNGYYLLFPVDLPNEELTTSLVAELLAALAAEFNTATAHIDTTVSNAARILGLIGTRKMKGDQLPDRPHRRSLLEMEANREILLTAEMIRSFAGDRAADERGHSNSGTPFGRTAHTGASSLKKILDGAGVEVRTQNPDARGFTWYHVEQCPFHDDGQPFECGVGQQLPDGPYAGHCFHPEGAGKGWRDWKVALGLGASSSERAGAILKLTDIGNAERLARDYADNLRYCRVHSCWYHWDGRRWARDDTGVVERLAKATVRRIYEEAAIGGSEEIRAAVAKHAIRSESNRAIQSMLARAQVEEAFAVKPTDFDGDPWVLNCLNGTIDLRSGNVRPHNREQMITKLAPVSFDPTARDERWEDFLHSACEGDLDLRGFLQVFFGYGLTGVTSEEKVAFLQGPGGTGKGTFMEAIKATIGDYVATADFETFLIKTNNGGPRQDIARLAGARLVIASEADDGRRLSTGVLKQLTGGDTVTARFLYGREFEFVPQFKLCLVANDAPKLKATDSGAWRRLLKVPFSHRIPDAEQDKSLKEYLKTAARPAVLAWLVEGCLLWQREGLSVPEAVSQATHEYRSSSDAFGEFFDDELDFTNGAKTSSADLYRAYKVWTMRTGAGEVASQQDLAASLEARGCAKTRGAGGTRGWLGVRIRCSDPRPSFRASDEGDAGDGEFGKTVIARNHKAGFRDSASPLSPLSPKGAVGGSFGRCPECGAPSARSDGPCEGCQQPW